MHLVNLSLLKVGSGGHQVFCFVFVSVSVALSFIGGSARQQVGVDCVNYATCILIDWRSSNKSEAGMQIVILAAYRNTHPE